LLADHWLRLAAAVQADESRAVALIEAKSETPRAEH
jgi:hypothetical protein